MAGEDSVDRAALKLTSIARAVRSLADRVQENWPQIASETSEMAELLRRRLARTIAIVAYPYRKLVDIDGLQVPELGDRSPAIADEVLTDRLETTSRLCSVLAYPDARESIAELDLAVPIYEKLRHLAVDLEREAILLTPADLRKRLDCGAATLRKFGQLAQVQMPKRGGRDHLFSAYDVLRICDAVLENSTNEELRRHATALRKEMTL